MKLFRKPKSKFYWYDFTVRGQRYRGSTQETNAARAPKVAGLKLAQAVDGIDPLPSKPAALVEFSRRFLDWLDEDSRDIDSVRGADAAGIAGATGRGASGHLSRL